MQKFSDVAPFLVDLAAAAHEYMRVVAALKDVCKDSTIKFDPLERFSGRLTGAANELLETCLVLGVAIDAPRSFSDADEISLFILESPFKVYGPLGTQVSQQYGWKGNATYNLCIGLTTLATARERDELDHPGLSGVIERARNHAKSLGISPELVEHWIAGARRSRDEYGRCLEELRAHLIEGERIGTLQTPQQRDVTPQKVFNAPVAVYVEGDSVGPITVNQSAVERMAGDISREVRSHLPQLSVPAPLSQKISNAP